MNFLIMVFYGKFGPTKKSENYILCKDCQVIGHKYMENSYK